MAKELTWPEAIQQVLSASEDALHYEDITNRIIELGLRTNLGATPSFTVSSAISTSLKKKGENSPFIRVSEGMYHLRSLNRVSIAPTPKQSDSSFLGTEDESHDIITSLGMFWRRDAVDWGSNPKVLGMQRIGSTPVDFCNQLGIYLLYDGREVIYVGRSSDRPLGIRLFEHTKDRLATRWDRFSWFGLKPVSESGELKPIAASYSSQLIITALEALLIEALEPRQNRKRGDDLSAVEYIQMEDPNIERRRKNAILQSLIERS
jgi:hypothetical protein